jgi:SAM-dependent methyltransferase
MIQQAVLWQDDAAGIAADRLTGPAIDVDEILALVGTVPPATVLDMSCSTGRHAVEFARRGFAVTGVSSRRIDLAHAADRSELVGVAVEWVQADVRSFVRKESFDLAVNLNAAIGRSESQQDALAMLVNVRRSLTNGGRLVLQVPLTSDRSSLRRVSLSDASDRTVRQPITAYDLSLLLTDAGFSSVRVYGGLDGSRFDPAGSHVLAVARKGGRGGDS